MVITVFLWDDFWCAFVYVCFDPDLVKAVLPCHPYCKVFILTIILAYTFLPAVMTSLSSLSPQWFEVSMWRVLHQQEVPERSLLTGGGV